MWILDRIHRIAVKHRFKQLTDSFADSEYQMKTNPRLIEAIEKSKSQQKMVCGRNDHTSYFDSSIYKQACRVQICNERSFQAASRYNNMRICVLNFACSTDPGGGVLFGSMGQEEALCRCSTLYPCLITDKMMSSFYKPHIESGDFIGEDDCIYTPGVVVFKTDEFYPKNMDESKWFKSDVITCSAPALNHTELNGSSLYEIHYKRLRRILDIAVNNSCEVMVLGAFGCGAFKNEPHIVAEAMMNVVKHYRFCFKEIIFAIPTNDRCAPNGNYDIFRTAIDNFFGENSER